MSDPAAGRVAEAMRRAIEARNAEVLASLYADNAELRVVDRNRTPSSPLVLRGKQAIADFLKDICERDMTHRIEQEVIGENRGWTAAHANGFGTRVFHQEELTTRPWPR